MNSPASFPANRIDRASPDALEDCAEQTVVPFREAANESAAQNGRLDPKPGIESMRAAGFDSPLLVLTFGIAGLLLAMAAVVAFG